MIATHQTRILALDGLRAVSILLVLFSHAWLGHIVPGGLGVTIFFFISGFIITRLMITEWDASGTVSIKKFYLRRFFRLMPALIVFVLASLIVMQMAGVHWAWVELASVFFYFANYFGIFIGFSGDVLPPPLSITWSLAVEEHFYMVFPFVFLTLIGLPKRFLMAVLSLSVILLVWRVYLVYGVGLDHLAHDRIYKATDTRADSIMYGTAFAVLMSRFPAAAEIFHRRATLIVGVVLMLVSLLYRDENFRESYRYSLQGIALACMFSYLVLNDTFASRLLSAKVMNYLGKISYSLYLYHWLVFGIITVWIPMLSLPVRIIIMIVASLVLADLSYRLIERPCLNYGRRYLH